MIFSINTVREQSDDIERLVDEIRSCDVELSDLKSQIGAKQQVITNAKISQSMRLAQISRLSGLSQPIELDHTYFFIDRFPHSQHQPQHLTGSSSSATPLKNLKTENLRGLGLMRTGEGVLLEARLNELSNLLEGHIFSFSSMASTLNTNPKNHTLVAPQIMALRTKAETLLKDYEKSEQRSFAFLLLLLFSPPLTSRHFRLLATVDEILSLRLEMIRLQRDAIENDYHLQLLEERYETEKRAMEMKITTGTEALRERYLAEYRAQDERYDHEIEKFEQKITRATQRHQENQKKTKSREEKLKEAVSKSQER
jgi:hypothetical protein